MSQQAASSAITTLQVLAVVGTLLQFVLTGLITWLLKTTLENKEKLGTIHVVLFGPNGTSGIIAELASFKKDEESLRRTMQRVVLRLGAIEDELKIPRTTEGERLADSVEDMERAD